MRRYALSTIACAVLILAGAGASFAQSHFNASDTHELQAFHLNDDIVQKYRNATAGLEEYTKTHNGSDLGDDREDEATDLSDMAAAYTKVAAIGSILKSKGITPRDYVKTMFILTSGYAVVSMQKSGMPVRRMPVEVSAENLEYIRRNYDRLKSLLDYNN